MTGRLDSAASTTLLNRLRAITGPAHLLTGDRPTRRYRKGYRYGEGRALAVVRPGTLLEQWRVFKAVIEAGCAVIMQAANTGLNGGSTPYGDDYDRDIVVINTLRVNRIDLLDGGRQVICLAGSTLHQLEARIRPLGREPHSVIGSTTIGASVVGGAAKILRLEDYLQRKPAQLSGGQRQRVAIGRAIVRDPQVFLFDEPLSNLDAELRVQMRVELSRLHKMLGKTMIYVTHDQTEALTMADRIVVLRAGRIEQIGAPIDLYQNPDNAFVAGFIGSPRMNFLPATVQPNGRLAAAGIEVDSPSRAAFQPGRVLQLGLRPEHLDEPDGISLEASVDFVEMLGSTSYVHATLATGETVIAERRSSLPRASDKITLRFAPVSIRLFGEDGQSIR